MASGVQTIRFRGNKPATPAGKQQQPKLRHVGLLQDRTRRTSRAPWTPRLLIAARMLLMVRFAGAMYSNITDCDEVFNFWEPLHFATTGYGFQTWELSPAYAIRSWAYVLLHAPFALLPLQILQKRQAFFAVRILFAATSAFIEAKFYRAVVDCVNERVGRYLLFMLLTSAGMWNASTAFLPSTFAMYTTMLGMSYFMFPTSALGSRLPYNFPTGFKRVLYATLSFAAGAVVGWPFSILLAIPFVFEELFLAGADVVDAKSPGSWWMQRTTRLVQSGLIAAVALIVPVLAIDTIAYGRFVLTPLNIVLYNVFGGKERGPELYGTEPASFYILNLLLNFNILLPLALASLPALTLTYMFDRERVEAGFIRIFAQSVATTKKTTTSAVMKAMNVSSAYTTLAVRLAPLYLWLGVLTAQPHKEERFMFPAYPLMCFNAAVTLYLARGWAETLFIKATRSPYRASITGMFSTLTRVVIFVTSLISISRILALNQYYHAPLSLAYHFEYHELPRLLNVTGLLPSYEGDERDEPTVDLAPVAQFNLSLCLGKEWYRFPGHFLVPNSVRVNFVKSAFDGQLPRHFDEDAAEKSLLSWDGLFRRLEVTRRVPSDLNDLNREEVNRYVNVDTCDYLVDLDFPHRPAEEYSTLEPRYALQDDKWERIACRPFLDASRSPLLTRTLWLPGLDSRNSYGDYCLLLQKKRASVRETPVIKSYWS
ncbi:glycosyltransferase family 22 protein [Auriculariales sp. MPI-PUGE-AT-0066]|nr:glycosyltransferase family 22 protein [Auriculariales sp. MPI-PUGE-AT-0066]